MGFIFSSARRHARIQSTLVEVDASSLPYRCSALGRKRAKGRKALPFQMRRRKENTALLPQTKQINRGGMVSKKSQQGSRTTSQQAVVLCRSCCSLGVQLDGSFVVPSLEGGVPLVFPLHHNNRRRADKGIRQHKLLAQALNSECRHETAEHTR